MTGRDDKLSLAVVIPTFNEAATLGRTLQSLAACGETPAQILVADGGSTDDTVEVAKSLGAETIVTTRRGRGYQIAEALKYVAADVVLVLHADMTLPRGALDLIREQLRAHPACPGGCLGHRFDNCRRMYRLVEWWDRWRARFGCPYGDQGQFFRREPLQRSGGFPDQPLMEDVELSRRLNALGRQRYIDCPVTVASRRFERLGWTKVVLGNLGLRMAYRLGGQRAVHALYRYYYPTLSS